MLKVGSVTRKSMVGVREAQIEQILSKRNPKQLIREMLGFIQLDTYVSKLA